MLKALDLFCCQGGAAMGLYRAGYEVTGVDIKPQPRYPFRFIQADAMGIDWTGYDLIWASPPCQRYSVMTPVVYKDNHSDLLPVVLERLRAQETPYIVENVEGTQKLMRNPIYLCGTMFGLNIWRHRWFELGNTDAFFLLPPCNHSGIPVLITGRGMRGVAAGKKRPGRVAIDIKRDAIGIDWMTSDGITEAIPPCYSEFLAQQMLLDRERETAQCER